MKTKLIMTFLLLASANQAFGEKVGDTSAQPPASPAPAATADQPPDEVLNGEHSTPRDCKLNPCVLVRRSLNMSEAEVRRQLKDKMINYAGMRSCIWGTTGHVPSDCVKKAGFCKISSTLKDHLKFPIGTVIVYHRKSPGRRDHNVGSIKTGENRYYTGMDISAPMPDTAGRRLLGVYASGDACKNVR